MEWGRPIESDGAPGTEPGDDLTEQSGSDLRGATDRPRGRVLVCDDAEQIRRLVRLNLELEGYEVVEAPDGPAALEILQDTARPLPDVITLDVIMPRRDGWWTVSTIRADPRLARIPIVMVTASAQDRDRAQAQRAEVDEFVTKPFDPYELVTKIGALVGRSRA
jgi:CheY-like chemotaxis protein